jgi:hypothetical protein
VAALVPVRKVRPEIEELEAREVLSQPARPPLAAARHHPRHHARHHATLALTVQIGNLGVVPGGPAVRATGTTPSPVLVEPAPRALSTCSGTPGPVASPSGRTFSPLSAVADTPFNANTPGVDLTDTYVFPSPANPNNIVLVMDIHPLIPPGNGPSTVFDGLLARGAQFNIDTNGSGTASLVLQFLFGPPFSGDLSVHVGGVGPPARTGVGTSLLPPDPVVGMLNQPFTTSTGIRVFAGARQDPAFFDFSQFWTIFPDRAFPVTGGEPFTNTHGQQVSTTPANPDQPMDSGFRPAGQAEDFLKGFNILSIVAELPRSKLGTGVMGVWSTIGEVTCDKFLQNFGYGRNNQKPGLSSGSGILQHDRAGNPLVDEIYATVAGNRHVAFDNGIPADDANDLVPDIQTFMTVAAGRSAQTTAAAEKLLVPDEILVDLSKSGPAGYLGVQTKGALGTPFGGRSLTDDVASTDLGITFGNTLAQLGLAPDDGHETPTLATDIVNPGAAAKGITNVFPYLGPPT